MKKYVTIPETYLITIIAFGTAFGSWGLFVGADITYVYTQFGLAFIAVVAALMPSMMATRAKTKIAKVTWAIVALMGHSWLLVASKPETLILTWRLYFDSDVPDALRDSSLEMAINSMVYLLLAIAFSIALVRVPIFMLFKTRKVS